jgi:hypothetical protein
MPEEPKKIKVSPARRTAFAGIVAALSCVLLYLAFVFPYARISVLFILSLLPIVLTSERRYADAILAFVASALISGLLFPAPDIWLLYTTFFGWYGIFREFAVSRLNKVLAWVALAAAFNAAFFALYFLASQLFLQIKIPPVLIIPAAEAAFVVFEVFYGRCRAYYAARIRKLIFRGYV